jgi:hypothetical protein
MEINGIGSAGRLWHTIPGDESQPHQRSSMSVDTQGRLLVSLYVDWCIDA